MREIKFRAWDKNNLTEKMMYTKIEYFDDMIALRFKHFDSEPKDIILMQHTGRKDKNGKEIYEGDILKIVDHYAKINFIGVVEFYNSSFLINQDDCIRHYRWLDYECEILGNIYENPELLEEADD